MEKRNRSPETEVNGGKRGRQNPAATVFSRPFYAVQRSHTLEIHKQIETNVHIMLLKNGISVDLS